MTALADGVVARGKRLVLREKRLGDAHDDYRWRSEPELARYDAARPLAMTFQEYLALFREDLLFPSAYRRGLAIEDSGGIHIGNVMYYNVDTIHHEAELGITIGDQSYWGHGFGTEAVRLLVEWLLGPMALRRVHLKTLSWNERARRSFEKAGFIECGQAERNGHRFILMEFRREWLLQPDEEQDAQDEFAGPPDL